MGVFIKKKKKKNTMVIDMRDSNHHSFNEAKIILHHDVTVQVLLLLTYLIFNNYTFAQIGSLISRRSKLFLHH